MAPGIWLTKKGFFPKDRGGFALLRFCSGQAYRELESSNTSLLWEEFFADPSQWWDNRSHKQQQRHARFPDFTHKTRKDSLWIENRLNPPWVHAKLAAAGPGQDPKDAGKVARVEQLWQNLFSDPSQWWDNRCTKKISKHPDFKHKTTLEGLWLHCHWNPPWVEAKISSMGLGEVPSGVGFKLRESNSYDGDVVKKLCQQGRLEEALHRVELIAQQNNDAPTNAFACLLKGCGQRKALALGKQVHALMAQKNWDLKVFLANHLIDMYSKCGNLLDAHKVFTSMPQRNVISWTAIMSAYADRGQFEKAINLFQQMQDTGIAPDKVAFIVVLKVCAKLGDLEQGKHIHSLLKKGGLQSDVIVQSALIAMYAKCGCIGYARELFNNMGARDVVTWSAMIRGYVQNDLGNQALGLYEQMKQEGVRPDKVTSLVVLKACTSIGSLEQGKQLHLEIKRRGFESDLIVQSSLVDMYAKCGCLEDAQKLFNNMTERDVVSWSAIIQGYAQNGLGKEALALYEQMKQEGVQPDKVTYIVVLKVCASIAAVDEGKQLHLEIKRRGFESDVVVQSTLIDMYAKCGYLEDARELFHKMQERDVVTWSAMIQGYVQNGLGEEALTLYDQMKQEGVQPNKVTFLVVLTACASIAALEQGKQLHLEIRNRGFELDVNVQNTLVDMYAKCGSLDSASEVFSNMGERDVVSWNAMIQGHVQHGLGMEALALYKQMKQEGVQPNKVTYISVLSACSHSGLVHEGHCVFEDMCKVSGVTPTLEHYACMIDMLGRAGCLDNAEELFGNANLA